MKRQLSTKFEECILKNDAATPLTISNFSRAWQAYFWSYTLQILCENTTFIDVQMMCSDDFDISSGFRFEKIWLSCTVHICSLYLDNDTLSCEFCGKILKSKINSERLMVTVHLANLSFMSKALGCEFCGKNIQTNNPFKTFHL